MTSTIQDIKRVREIVNIITKHGFGHFLGNSIRTIVPGLKIKQPNQEVEALPRAERARMVLEELGPTYVKLGQILSSRPDLLPADIIDSFKHLQNDVPPMPEEKVREVVESYLGSKLDDVFVEFDPRPMAAASIAQVHRARLKMDDQLHDVVVKIQRPMVRDKIECDIAILYFIARMAESSIEEAGLYQPVGVMREFEAALLQELDFLNEAKNIEEIRRNFHNRPGLLEIPRVFEHISSQRLLVMSYIEGIRITDIVEDPDYDRELLLKKTLDICFYMVFEDGFFHGDPHPGNILVHTDGRVGMIDYGLMGRLTRDQQDTLLLLLMAVLLKNPANLSKLILKIGQVGPAFDRVAFEAEVRELMDRYLELDLSEIDVEELVRDAFELVAQHRIKIPPNFAILARALATVDGMGRVVYPNVNVLTVGMPWLKKLFVRQFDPTNLSSEWLNLAFGMSQLIQEVPTQMGQLLDELSSSRFQVGIKGPVLDQYLWQQRIHGLRMVVTAAVASLLLTGAITIAPFKYTLKDLGMSQLAIPIVPLLCFLTMLVLVVFLVLTYLFPTGPRKVRMRRLLARARKARARRSRRGPNEDQ